MKRVFYLISVLLISFAVYSQTGDKKAKGFYYSGVDKVKKKDYPGAISDFSEAIKHDSGFIQAYENRGVAKFYLQDYTGAISDYTRALQIDPDDYSTLGRRGWAKFNIQEYEGAIADFSLVINSGSAGRKKKGEAYYSVGLIKIHQGQKDSGCLDLRKAAESGYLKAKESIGIYCR